jgi:copper chaperone CopZ
MRSFVLALSLTALSPLAGATPPPGTTTAQPAGETVIARVNGLVCDFCARAVDRVFRRRAEVADVKVDLSTQTLTFTLKPGARMEDATVRTLVRDAGYALVSIERQPAVTP